MNILAEDLSNRIDQVSRELLCTGAGTEIKSPELNAKLKRIVIPDPVLNLLEAGASLVISVSGGKDSDVMLDALSALHREHGWTGKIFAVFSDLGRIEWTGVREHIRRKCQQADVPLIKTRRKLGGMIDRWEQRRIAIIKSGKIIPHFSSPTNRYCTKENKTDPIDAELRQFDTLICAVGIRAEESAKRAKEPRYKVRSNITTQSLREPALKDAEAKERYAEWAAQEWLSRKERKPRERFALTWHPILDFSLADVLGYYGHTIQEWGDRIQLFAQGKIRQALDDWKFSWVYVAGNSRLSCSLCIMSNAFDMQNGATLNPYTWLELVFSELESGYAFQQGKALYWFVETMPIDQPRFVRRLHRELQSLGRIDPSVPQFCLQLLQTQCTTAIALWTDEFFGVALKLVKQYIC